MVIFDYVVGVEDVVVDLIVEVDFFFFVFFDCLFFVMFLYFVIVEVCMKDFYCCCVVFELIVFVLIGDYDVGWFVCDVYG